MKEVGDGCDASDVDGAGEAGEDALEELPGEVEAGGRRRVWRGSGGGGGGGEAARAAPAARRGGHRQEKKFPTKEFSFFLPGAAPRFVYLCV